jgi:hypothetical protein
MFIQTPSTDLEVPSPSKGRMRQIKSSTFADDFDLLTPTLPEGEGEKEKCLFRKERSKR